MSDLVKPTDDRYTIKLPRLRGKLREAVASRLFKTSIKFYGDCSPVVEVDFRGPLRLREVPDDAPKNWRVAVESHARMFKREFQYDFMQYIADDPQENRRVFMWVRNSAPFYAFGSICFRARLYLDEPGPPKAWWDLDWVWMHPYLRRQGLLQSAWPYLIRRFGEFNVTHPVSPAMQEFVTRHGKPYGEPLDRNFGCL